MAAPKVIYRGEFAAERLPKARALGANGFSHLRRRVDGVDAALAMSQRDISYEREREAYFFFLRAAGFLEGALRFFFAKSCDTSTSSSSSSET